MGPKETLVQLTNGRPSCVTRCVMCTKKCCPLFTLPCHVVCTPCLTLLVHYRDPADVILCPQCFRIHPFDDTWRKQFKLTIRNDHTDWTGIKPCTRCRRLRHKPATFAQVFCHQCHDYLCRHCHVTVHVFMTSADKRRHHIIVPLIPESWAVLKEPLTSYCSIHIDQSQSLFCVTCREVLCWDCAQMAHRGHDLWDVKGHVCGYQAALETRLVTMQQHEAVLRNLLNVLLCLQYTHLPDTQALPAPQHHKQHQLQQQHQSQQSNKSQLQNSDALGDLDEVESLAGPVCTKRDVSDTEKTNKQILSIVKQRTLKGLSDMAANAIIDDDSDDVVAEDDVNDPAFAKSLRHQRKRPRNADTATSDDDDNNDTRYEIHARKSPYALVLSTHALSIMDPSIIAASISPITDDGVRMSQQLAARRSQTTVAHMLTQGTAEAHVLCSHVEREDVTTPEPTKSSRGRHEDTTREADQETLDRSPEVAQPDQTLDVPNDTSSSPPHTESTTANSGERTGEASVSSMHVRVSTEDSFEKPERAGSLPSSPTMPELEQAAEHATFARDECSVTLSSVKAACDEVFGTQSVAHHLWSVRTLHQVLLARMERLCFDLCCDQDPLPLSCVSTWVNSRPVMTDKMYQALVDRVPKHVELPQAVAQAFPLTTNGSLDVNRQDEGHRYGGFSQGHYILGQSERAAAIARPSPASPHRQPMFTSHLYVQLQSTAGTAQTPTEEGNIVTTVDTPGQDAFLDCIETFGHAPNQNATATSVHYDALYFGDEEYDEYDDDDDDVYYDADDDVPTLIFVPSPRSQYRRTATSPLSASQDHSPSVENRHVQTSISDNPPLVQRTGDDVTRGGISDGQVTQPQTSTYETFPPSGNVAIASDDTALNPSREQGSVEDRFSMYSGQEPVIQLPSPNDATQRSR